MQRVMVEPDFDAWRAAARDALQAGFAPSQIQFVDVTAAQSLTLPYDEVAETLVPPQKPPHVPSVFLKLARKAAAHRDPERWNLLYRILYRLQSVPGLLRVEVDGDVAEMRRLDDQVSRDIHKMHAFVRFRMIDEPAADGRTEEHAVAFYQPDHRILPLAAPFFAERFAVMRWTILTADESVAWSPSEGQLHFGPGVGREHAPAEDELEGLWKSYYGAIFNPARLNQRAMRNEMPVRYWRNLPEADAMPHLIQKAGERVATMITQQQEKPTAAPFVPAKHTLPHILHALPTCKGCDLFRCATQVVPGVGNAEARMMLVGEQPGDQEDRRGLPFIGPAGEVLRRALDELRIDPDTVFMTNAVKHFKFVQRGKFRLHQNPRMGEINACKPWLLAELDAVKPQVVLCLGASAAKSLLGGTFALMRERGELRSTPYADRVMATVHPSAVLRARDDASRQQLYQFLKHDLASAWKLANGAA